MKEIILHYLWLHKHFDVTHIFSTKNEKIEILNSGQYLQTSGPDFFNAQLIIGNQKWAGNIEIHVKSSDWYLHQHEKDANYDNVILHVVWEHDVEIYRKDKTEIPVLELKNFISTEVISKIQNLLQKKSWINCENQLSYISEITWVNWKERLYLNRLESKSNIIFEILNSNNNDWEATCFILLAKNFGLNINGNSFFDLFKDLPFSIIRKESFLVQHLEALFFGRANLLNDEFEDEYAKELKSIWQYQKTKYNLEEQNNNQVQFYKLRPDNFPTIRLAQLAGIYVANKNLFESIINIKSFSELKNVFKVNVSEYWQNHYNLDKLSKKKIGKISDGFIELVIINTIVPIQFAYSKYKGEENFESILNLLQELKPEKNVIIERFLHLNVKVEDAFDSQALLQLKKEYCDVQKCLKCKIGIELLQKS